MTNADLLTVREVARRAKVSERTVWRWVEDGRLPAIRVGGIVRFQHADVDALLTPDPDQAAS
ncbi:MAG TPA: helix-turn-helix domain-containing protein [Acidimicrobiales bacterium]|nr:helix-turn-helix domain-containing protein [Acidimicrobiales bacterium]